MPTTTQIEKQKMTLYSQNSSNRQDEVLSAWTVMLAGSVESRIVIRNDGTIHHFTLQSGLINCDLRHVVSIVLAQVASLNQQQRNQSA